MLWIRHLAPQLFCGLAIVPATLRAQGADAGAGDSTAGGGGSNCCFQHITPGCDNPGCENAVCSIDPLCCLSEWDSICAGEAATLCNELCGSPGSNCCSPHGGIGCEDQSCENAVCTLDPFCCRVKWDSVCAGEAADLCEVCGGDLPPCPWDCDGSNDDNVNVTDLLTLLAQYDILAPAVCDGGESCDYDGNGCVDVTDLLKMLSHFSLDPGGIGCQ